MNEQQALEYIATESDTQAVVEYFERFAHSKNVQAQLYLRLHRDDEVDFSRDYRCFFELPRLIDINSVVAVLKQYADSEDRFYKMLETFLLTEQVNFDEEEEEPEQEVFEDMRIQIAEEQIRFIDNRIAQVESELKRSLEPVIEELTKQNPSITREDVYRAFDIGE